MKAADLLFENSTFSFSKKNDAIFVADKRSLLIIPKKK